VSAGAVVVIAIAGFLCGVVNTVAGGGSLILFPVLVGAGLPPLQANVTNTVATWPGYLGGIFGFSEELRADHRRLRPLVLASIAGSSLGCALLLLTPSSAFDAIVPVLVLAASVLVAIQPRVAKWVGNPGEGGRRIRIPLVFLATIYGGYFGGSLGVILLAVLVFTLRGTIRQLTALKAGLSFIDGTVGLIAFAFFGPVRWVAAAVAAPTTLLGGYLGASIARHIEPRTLRMSVVVFGVVAAIYLWVR